MNESVVALRARTCDQRIEDNGLRSCGGDLGGDDKGVLRLELGLEVVGVAALDLVRTM
jgi:hypothetical protein